MLKDIPMARAIIKYYKEKELKKVQKLMEIVDIQKHSLKEDQDELENLLIINGILKQIGNQKYNFAFLYKYRLGLKNRRKGKRR